jgi:hypothetical protein
MRNKQTKTDSEIKKISSDSAKSGLSLKSTLALIIIIFLLGVGGTVWYYALCKVVLIKTFDIEVNTVSDLVVGLNADPNLHFGKIPNVGGIAKKTISFANSNDFPVLVKISFKGKAARFIETEDNTFLLNPDETRNLDVFAVIPDNFNRVGTYRGAAKIMYIKR